MSNQKRKRLDDYSNSNHHSKDNLIQENSFLSTSNAVNKNQSSTLSSGCDLEKMKQIAIERGREKDLLNENLKKKRNLQKQAQRYDSAILISDTIRLIYISKNRTAFPVKYIISSMADMIKMSLSDIKFIIHSILIKIIPEFFMVVPRDDVVTEDILKLNFNANYLEVREKLKIQTSKFKLNL
jgi:hypothetical protein